PSCGAEGTDRPFVLRGATLPANAMGDRSADPGVAKDAPEAIDAHRLGARFKLQATIIGRASLLSTVGGSATAALTGTRERLAVLAGLRRVNVRLPGGARGLRPRRLGEVALRGLVRAFGSRGDGVFQELIGDHGSRFGVECHDLDAPLAGAVGAEA